MKDRTYRCQPWSMDVMMVAERKSCGVEIISSSDGLPFRACFGTIVGPGHQSMSFDIADENQGTVFAQAPFDHVDAADIIIRSSDGMHFRMIKLLLSLVSPIFKDLFNLPRSTEEEGIDETKDGLPIVDLTEKSGTIKNLLSFCYPAIYNGDVGLETL